MGKKRDRANENIENLILELICARKEALGNTYCPYGGSGNSENDCEHISCSDCKKKYFEIMREQLLQEYIVK